MLRGVGLSTHVQGRAASCLQLLAGARVGSGKRKRRGRAACCLQLLEGARVWGAGEHKAGGGSGQGSRNRPNMRWHAATWRWLGGTSCSLMPNALPGLPIQRHVQHYGQCSGYPSSIPSTPSCGTALPRLFTGGRRKRAKEGKLRGRQAALFVCSAHPLTCRKLGLEHQSAVSVCKAAERNDQGLTPKPRRLQHGLWAHLKPCSGSPCCCCCSCSPGRAALLGYRPAPPLPPSRSRSWRRSGLQTVSAWGSRSAGCSTAAPHRRLRHLCVASFVAEKRTVKHKWPPPPAYTTPVSPLCRHRCPSAVPRWNNELGGGESRPWLQRLDRVHACLPRLHSRMCLEWHHLRRRRRQLYHQAVSCHCCMRAAVCYTFGCASRHSCGAHLSCLLLPSSTGLSLQRPVVSRRQLPRQAAWHHLPRPGLAGLPGGPGPLIQRAQRAAASAVGHE